MTKKCLSFVTAVALVCCLCKAPAYASSGSDPKEPTAKSATPTESSRAEKSEAQEKLKADVTRLVSDAKAGKLKMPAQHFPQPKRNNLSTGAKIAIISGIAAAVFVIIILASLADDDS